MGNMKTVSSATKKPRRPGPNRGSTNLAIAGFSVLALATVVVMQVVAKRRQLLKQNAQREVSLSSMPVTESSML